MARKKYVDPNKIKIIRSGIGSIELVRKNKSNGMFFCEDKGKIIFIDNIIMNKEYLFNSMTEFEKFVEETYS